MQKRAARVITGLNYEIRSKTIFQNLGWNPIEIILKKRELLITFKAICGTAPESICNMFSNCANAKLTLDKPNRSFLKKSLILRSFHLEYTAQ